MTILTSIEELEALYGQPGQAASGARIDGAAYDREWPQRARKTMW